MPNEGLPDAAVAAPRGQGRVAPRTVPIVVGSVCAAGMLLIVLVVTGLVPLFAPPPHESCTALECGDAVVVGNPVMQRCPSDGSWATTGCSAGDYLFLVAIQSSSLTYGEVSLKVVNATLGVVVAATGDPGFAIVNSTGAVTAAYPVPGGVMSMNADWTYAAAATASTLLTNLDSLVLDMGLSEPQGQGYVLEVSATVDGSGFLANLPLS